GTRAAAAGPAADPPIARRPRRRPTTGTPERRKAAMASAVARTAALLAWCPCRWPRGGPGRSRESMTPMFPSPLAEYRELAAPDPLPDLSAQWCEGSITSREVFLGQWTL